MEITIHSEYITLGQFLKMQDWISSGGEAKTFLTQEKIYVNGELESRRGRKLYPGDSVRLKDQTVQVRKGVE